DPRAGEIVCRTCAVVLGERCIDDGAEWRTFTTDDVSNKPDPSRCGEPNKDLACCSSIHTSFCLWGTTAGRIIS
ncbi:unnamed protein product, partial [Laminaria digitata]